LHVLDHKGKAVFAEDLPANPAAFLAAIRPDRNDLVVWRCLSWIALARNLS
jgi:hypothetical protein